MESRDVSLIFVAPPIAIEVFFTASQSQPSTAYATFTSALPPVDIDFFFGIYFLFVFRLISWHAFEAVAGSSIHMRFPCEHFEQNFETLASTSSYMAHYDWFS